MDIGLKLTWNYKEVFKWPCNGLSAIKLNTIKANFALHELLQ